MFTNPEPLWISLLRVFVEASSCRHGWLNHWLLVIEFMSSPSSPSCRFEGGAESSNFLIHMVGSSDNQPWLSKSHFISINLEMVERGLPWTTKDAPFTLHSGNYEGFRNSESGTREGDQTYISYNITVSQIKYISKLLYTFSALNFFLKNPHFRSERVRRINHWHHFSFQKSDVELPKLVDHMKHWNKVVYYLVSIFI